MRTDGQTDEEVTVSSCGRFCPQTFSYFSVEFPGLDPFLGEKSTTYNDDFRQLSLELKPLPQPNPTPLGLTACKHNQKYLSGYVRL